MVRRYGCLTAVVRYGGSEEARFSSAGGLCDSVPGLPYIVLMKRRCKRCGRFMTESKAELCLQCFAVASIAWEPASNGASPSGSGMSALSRFRADLGLDLSLQEDTRNEDTRNRDFSRPRDPDAAGVTRGATSGGQSNVVQPPSPAFLNTPSWPRIEPVVPRSRRLLPAPTSSDGASKSVLTRIGPRATEKLPKEWSGTGKARRLSADVGRAARTIAIGVVVISVSAAVGAAVPLLLSLLGR